MLKLVIIGISLNKFSIGDKEIRYNHYTCWLQQINGIIKKR